MSRWIICLACRYSTPDKICAVKRLPRWVGSEGESESERIRADNENNKKRRGAKAEKESEGESDEPDELFSKRPKLLQHVCDGASGHVLENDEQESLTLGSAQVANNVRVVQRPHHRNFSPQLFHVLVRAVDNAQLLYRQ
jgi:hypothetical protein